MILLVFAPWVIGFIILYLAQKLIDNKIKIVLKIVGFVFITLPFAMILYGMFSATP